SLTMRNVAVTDCVRWAYNLASYQISADRVGSENYDILAKSDTAVPVGQLRVMLQELLVRRFQLAVHRETKMLPAYELTVAKGGPKLSPSKGDPSRPQVRSAESLPRVQNDSFLFSEVSMADFAAMLTQLRGIELPVVDRTGVTGTFDIALKSAPAMA